MTIARRLSADIGICRLRHWGIVIAPRWLCVGFAFVITCWPSPTPAADATEWLEKKLPEAIRARARRYGDQFAVESTLKSTVQENGRAKESVVRMRTVRSGDFVLQSASQDVRGDQNPIALTARSVNSKYYFEARRNKRNDAWLLAKVLDLPVAPPADEETVKSLRMTADDRALRSSGLQLLVGGYTQPEELSRLPGYRLVSMVEEKPGEQVVVQFEYTLKLGEGESAVSVCTAKYSATAVEPLLSCAEKVVSRGVERGRGHTLTLSDVGPNGYTFSTVGYSTALTNGKITSDRKNETNGTVRYGPTPESEFTCTAFGLPEPPGIDWSPGIPLYVWLAVLGVACVVGYGGFRYLADRTKT